MPQGSQVAQHSWLWVCSELQSGESETRTGKSACATKTELPTAHARIRAMSSASAELTENLARVRERIDLAASRAGRRAEEITLIAVSKTHSARKIQELYEAGVRHFGENRVQERESKLAHLSGARCDMAHDRPRPEKQSRASCPPVRQYRLSGQRRVSGETGPRQRRIHHRDHKRIRRAIRNEFTQLPGNWSARAHRGEARSRAGEIRSGRRGLAKIGGSDN